MAALPSKFGDRKRTLLAYVAMVVVAIAAFLLTQRFAGDLAAPVAADGAARFGSGSTHQGETLLHVLVAMVVIIVAARALGTAFRYLHQPPVVGEVVAGILLGPSFLGRLSPELAGYLLPPAVAPFLQVIAQVGVILFMFLVGLELDTGLLRKNTQATLVISHASIVLPFALGATTALFVYERLSSSDVPFSVFALFLGISMSVTAFPVLARILTDRGIHKTRLGVIAISCAAIDDVTAWCLLAFVVSLAQARSNDAWQTLLFSAAYVVSMLALVRPLLARLVQKQELVRKVTPRVTALILVSLLLSALASEFAGVHALFGAFLLGAVIPHQSLLAQSLRGKLEDLVVILFLPAFFAFTGMRTHIALVAGVENWLLCLGLLVVACAGKFGGGALAARFSGLSWRDSVSLGVLMNTRGLMELIVLNIGLDLRVISPTLFAMLVIMAVTTTFATTPLLHLLTRGRTLEEAGSWKEASS